MTQKSSVKKSFSKVLKIKKKNTSLALKQEMKITFPPKIQ